MSHVLLPRRAALTGLGATLAGRALAQPARPLTLVARIIERTAGVFEAHYEEAADLEPVIAELVGA